MKLLGKILCKECVSNKYYVRCFKANHHNLHYRNSYKKNTCIDMLRQGYHKSFSELFTLIQKWNALREAAGPGSAIWLQTSLEEQPDKLDQLHHFLTRAEAAQRAEHYEDMYNHQLNLAYCFNNPEDKWLRNYFYEQCHRTAKQIKIDGGKKEAESHANLGLVYEEQGQLMKAAEHYEAFHQLTVGRMWRDERGQSHNLLACEHLWRIYTLLADKMLENNEHQQAIKTLIKAFEMAKKGNLNIYIEISTALCDSVGLGKAYQAIAKVLVSQEKVTEAIKYLEKFVDIAKSAHHSRSLVNACTFLGNIYNERVSIRFRNYAMFANALTDLPLVDETKAYYGIAKAHNMMVAVNSHTEAVDHVTIEYLLAWKENRSDMCTDPFTVGKTLTCFSLNFLKKIELNRFIQNKENIIIIYFRC
uniref:Tetratricopeptide repeat protein 29 n=1 Tax=Sphenodon punctatus TaxID=8508 RepID=A0A8D0GNI2_SPHPU